MVIEELIHTKIANIRENLNDIEAWLSYITEDGIMLADDLEKVNIQMEMCLMLLRKEEFIT